MRPPAAERRRDRDGRLIALIIVALAAYNVARSAVIPDGAHFVANLAIAAAVLALGRAGRLTTAELGLRRERWGAGARLGLVALGVVTVVVTIAAVVPAFDDPFDDDRVAIGLPAMLWRVLVVIPLGTVLVEEIVFRGVLHGLLRRRHEIVAAALWGATLFGWWHVFPVWTSHDDGAVADLGRWSAVAGTFVATFVAGLVFVWLRHRSDSLVAPVLAHIGTNSIPFTVAWFVTR